jgi:hypothetical protein
MCRVPETSTRGFDVSQDGRWCDFSVEGSLIANRYMQGLYAFERL